ncbi:hypothetical protein QWY31_12220 [Cytophagales bacterium LB-30]|uniref:Outer membrane protein beta-barrel domain-containing protein n=1 Tax=Shiella aurantiaca TaxID=3058365 RepID=A0ABT8F7S4_9BACT|nr:outer membrane beta-barrel protein [Shiella aurantiaca]MDN4166271.1 hypothetical protein [Shiella aurantiaca]
MKPYSLLIGISFLVSLGGYAQEMNYALYAGASLTSLQSNMIAAIPKKGALAGFAAEKTLAESVALSIGFQFSHSGFQEPQQHSNGSELGIVTYNQYSLYYVQMPLLIRNPFAVNDKIDFYPIYGLNNAWLLQAKKLSENPQESEVIKEKLAGNDFYRYELVILAGLGMDWKLENSKQLFLQVRASQAISNWFGNRFISTKSDAYNRNVSLQMIAGIRF